MKPSCAEPGTAQPQIVYEICQKVLRWVSMVKSGRISSTEALKRGKLYVNLRTFLGHNSISKTDETRGWLSCAKHRLPLRWGGVGVTTDYLVAPVLNWTVLGCNNKFCLLVSIELQLFQVCPGGWMDGWPDYLENDHIQPQTKYGVGIIVWAWEKFSIHSISL